MSSPGRGSVGHAPGRGCVRAAPRDPGSSQATPDPRAPSVTKPDGPLTAAARPCRAPGVSAGTAVHAGEPMTAQPRDTVTVPARRADYGAVRLGNRDIDGLILCAEQPRCAARGRMLSACLLASMALQKLSKKHIKNRLRLS